MAVNSLNQGVSLSGLQTRLDPNDDVSRDWFSRNFWNATAIEREDWERNEIAMNNQLIRDLYLFEKQKAFTREQMEWQENLSNTAFQRAVEDMKKSGINPVMAINQGGASVPSVPSASASRSSSGYRSNYNGSSVGSLIGTILSVVAGIFGQGAKSANAIQTATISANAKKYAADVGYMRDVANRVENLRRWK